MSGVGGYVRRCERHNRNPPGHLRQRGDGWPYRSEIFWQSMPMLSFEPFDVEEPIDSPGMPPLALPHDIRTRTF